MASRYQISANEQEQLPWNWELLHAGHPSCSHVDSPSHSISIVTCELQKPMLLVLSQAQRSPEGSFHMSSMGILGPTTRHTSMQEQPSAPEVVMMVGVMVEVVVMVRVEVVMVVAAVMVAAVVVMVEEVVVVVTVEVVVVVMVAMVVVVVTVEEVVVVMVAVVVVVVMVEVVVVVV
ncbi:Potassium Voltage-Gated Channel Subfamily C Member 1 [Manis pentadactyla]|nr:Potassium Voltage-Gated Channel Subfamily C Member 1 [Manis pentadactyla]